MGLRITKTGDWDKARLAVDGINTRLVPFIKATIFSSGKFVLKKLQGHIDSQDLNWTPLSEKTVELKNGDETIYVETGFLRNNLEVIKVKSSKKDITYFIGASANKTHPSGVSFCDLMIWLEYGTDKMPPRPLIRPTLEEVNDILHSSWLKIIIRFIKGGFKL